MGRTKKAPQVNRDKKKSVPGFKESWSTSYKDGESDPSKVAGGSYGIGNASAVAEMNKNKVGGKVRGTGAEFGVRVGRDTDPLAANADASFLTGEVGGHYTKGKSFGLGAGGNLAKVSGNARLGEEGAQTPFDSSLTVGATLGAGAKGKFGANWGEDTDLDGFPNYGFNFSLQALAGVNFGVNVEQPMKQMSNFWSGLWSRPSPARPAPGPAPGPVIGRYPGALANQGSDSDSGSSWVGAKNPAVAEAMAAQEESYLEAAYGITPSAVAKKAPSAVPTVAAKPTVQTGSSSQDQREAKRDEHVRQSAQETQTNYENEAYGGPRASSKPAETKKSDSSSSSGGGGCYLTTAACQHRGLPDDCHALSTLRRFRDEVMGTTERGRLQIAEYYATAPTIVERIQAESNAARILENLWARWIVPSVQAIDDGQPHEAHRLYADMVVTLQKRFL